MDKRNDCRDVFLHTGCGGNVICCFYFILLDVTVMQGMQGDGQVFKLGEWEAGVGERIT